MSVQSLASKRLTLRDLHKRYKENQRLAMLTAYDVVIAELVDQAGVDLLLVGDSLGNVVLGYDTTLPVTLDDMIRHTAAVVRGSHQALVVCDMPFGTTLTSDLTLHNAARVLKETGCQAVKIEGGLPMAPTVQKLVENGIPVMAHIGLTPQSIHQLGGYYRHGKSTNEVDRLRASAIALQEAGAFAIVLECVVESVATQLTQELTIPTIGIGSGPHTSGQVLVINDLVGLSTRPAPSFAKPRAAIAPLIQEAAQAFVKSVREGNEGV